MSDQRLPVSVIGGFLGAWLGGLAFARFGDFTWMWYTDMALAVAAALVKARACVTSR